jgi:hypothetical protein
VVCVDRGGVGVTNHPSEQFLFSSGLGGTGLSAAEIAKRLLAHSLTHRCERHSRMGQRNADPSPKRKAAPKEKDRPEVLCGVVA